MPSVSAIGPGAMPHTRTPNRPHSTARLRVCGIAPGPIAETEGMKRLAPGELTDKMTAAIPAGRFGAIDEIAAAAVFLRSPAAAYITGHTLVVDGGHCVATPPLGMSFT